MESDQTETEKMQFDVGVVLPPLVEFTHIALEQQCSEMGVVDRHTGYVHETSCLSGFGHERHIRKAPHSSMDQVALSI